LHLFPLKDYEFSITSTVEPQFMTFALIFIAIHIDKIHTITNETALLLPLLAPIDKFLNRTVL
ncbi:hypothetical protein BV372_31600, partial [Nostoc sp. T09]|uniref:hypothetical protein n=1 Tax=Nostoc sp. T09 TaxID=1932621 RepID=UPI000B69A105